MMKKADVRQLFVRKWMNNYVPAILEYGEKSRKKEASQALENLDATGMLKFSYILHYSRYNKQVTYCK